MYSNDSQMKVRQEVRENGCANVILYFGMDSSKEHMKTKRFKTDYIFTVYSVVLALSIYRYSIYCRIS